MITLTLKISENLLSILKDTGCPKQVRPDRA
jgi:hypothetical protein